MAYVAVAVVTAPGHVVGGARRRPEDQPSEAEADRASDEPASQDRRVDLCDRLAALPIVALALFVGVVEELRCRIGGSTQCALDLVDIGFGAAPDRAAGGRFGRVAGLVVGHRAPPGRTSMYH